MVPMVGRICSTDRNSCRSSALKAQVSTTWVPWVLMILIAWPLFTRTARPLRAGTVISSLVVVMASPRLARVKKSARRPGSSAEPEVGGKPRQEMAVTHQLLHGGDIGGEEPVLLIARYARPDEIHCRFKGFARADRTAEFQPLAGGQQFDGHDSGTVVRHVLKASGRECRHAHEILVVRRSGNRISRGRMGEHFILTGQCRRFTCATMKPESKSPPAMRKAGRRL